MNAVAETYFFALLFAPSFQVTASAASFFACSAAAFAFAASAFRACPATFLLFSVLGLPMAADGKVSLVTAISLKESRRTSADSDRWEESYTPFVKATGGDEASLPSSDAEMSCVQLLWERWMPVEVGSGEAVN